MTTINKMPRWGQVVCGVSLLSIAVAAGLTGLKINVSHGLEVSPEAGVLFGLADLAKIALPIVAGLVGWSRQMRMTAAVCVVVSLWCAANAYIGGAGQQIAGKQHGADQYALAKDAVTKADAEVARLTGAVDAERKAGGCGKQCKFLQGSLETARQEAKEARTALSGAKAVDVTGHERFAAIVTAVLFLVLVEALVWTSVPAMALLNAPKPVEAKPASKPRQSRLKTAAKRTKSLAKPDWTHIESYMAAPKLTKSGRVDGRTKAGRAVRRITATKIVTA